MLLSTGALISKLKNGHQIAATSLAMVYTIGLLFVFVDSPTNTQLTAVTIGAVALTSVPPHLITSNILKRLFPNKQTRALLEILENHANEKDIYTEVPEEAIIDDLPDELSDFDQAKIIEEQVTEIVDGSKFDQTDARLRGAASLLIVGLGMLISSVFLIALFVDGFYYRIAFLTVGVISLGIILIAYNSMSQIVEYSSTEVTNENRQNPNQ